MESNSLVSAVEVICVVRPFVISKTTQPCGFDMAKAELLEASTDDVAKAADHKRLIVEEPATQMLEYVSKRIVGECVENPSPTRQDSGELAVGRCLHATTARTRTGPEIREEGKEVPFFQVFQDKSGKEKTLKIPGCLVRSQALLSSVYMS